MNNLEAMNGYVFFSEKNESRTVGGVELISEFDTDSRSGTGVVISAAKDVPLKEGDEFIYENKQEFDVYVNSEIVKVIHAARIIGKLK